MSFLYKKIIANPNGHTAPLLKKASANFGGSATEHLLIGYFDAERNLLKTSETLEGDCVSIAVPYRQIVRDALVTGADSVVLIHNHPSGDPSPSNTDITQTRSIANILKALGIRIDDHLIVSGDQHFSFYAAGLL
jgi:DNA repair protein RadC